MMFKYILLCILYYIIIINGQNCTEQNFPILNCPINQSSACCENITTCIDTNTQISQCLIGNCTGGPCFGCDFSNATSGDCFNTSISLCCNGGTICTNVTNNDEFLLCNEQNCSHLPCGFVDCNNCGSSLDCGFNGTEMLCNGTFSGILNTCIDKKDELSLCLTGICQCIFIIPPIIQPPITLPPFEFQEPDNTLIIISIIVGVVALLLIVIGLYVFTKNNVKKGFNKI